MDRKRIGLREVRALKPGEVQWDGAVIGFGIRRQRSDAVTYVLKLRTTTGRQRWHTIGRHGSPWTPDAARDEARRVLGDVAKGADPSGERRAARNSATVNTLCDLYWKEAETGRLLTRRRTPKRASTLASDRSRIDGHIRPLLGGMKVSAVSREDVQEFMAAVASGKTATRVRTEHGYSVVRGGTGTASKAVALLGAIFGFAVEHRMRADNPTRGVMRPADGRRTRRLSADEYAALGRGLRALERDMWPAALAVTRFLLMTGWRRGEALNLTWDAVNLDRRTAMLEETKTGRSIRALPGAACAVLRGLPEGAATSLVFPASRGMGRMSGYASMFDRIVTASALGRDVTPHVLRHSFASMAADLGYSELTIAALIGHKSASITSRYVHSADAVLLAAADAVAERIEQLLSCGTPTAKSP